MVRCSTFGNRDRAKCCSSPKITNLHLHDTGRAGAADRSLGIAYESSRCSIWLRLRRTRAVLRERAPRESRETYLHTESRSKLRRFVQGAKVARFSLSQGLLEAQPVTHGACRKWTGALARRLTVRDHTASTERHRRRWFQREFAESLSNATPTRVLREARRTLEDRRGVPQFGPLPASGRRSNNGRELRSCCSTGKDRRRQ